MFFHTACHAVSSTGIGRVPARPADRRHRAFNVAAAKTLRLTEAALVLTIVGLFSTVVWVLSGEESAMSAVVRAIQPPIFQSDLIDELRNYVMSAEDAVTE